MPQALKLQKIYTTTNMIGSLRGPKGGLMRATIAIGIVAAILLSLAPAANAAPDGFTFRTQQATPHNGCD